METRTPEAGNVTIVTRDGNGAPDQSEQHATSPVTAMKRLIDQMDRTLQDWSFGREWLSPFFGRDPLAKRMEGIGKDTYLPDIEVAHSDGGMTVRADLPGIRKEDITIELTSGAVIIKGERRREEKDQRDGYFRSERSYGSFYRSVPLPDGAEAEHAEASFNDGVLEVVLTTKKNCRKVEIR